MAEEQDKDQKTEQPSQHRIDQAMQQGQGPQSRELNHWFLIGTGTLIMLAFSSTMAASLTDTLRSFIAQPEQIPDDAAAIGGVLTGTLLKAGSIIMVPLILLVAAAVAGPLLQAGVIISAEKLKPKFSKISPLAGFHRLFSVRSLMEFLKSLTKLCIIGSISYMLVRPVLPDIEHMIEIEPAAMLNELRHLVVRLCFGIFATLTIVMMADMIYQRFSFIARLRMTRQEVKDEHKQNEGDPIIKQRIRQLRVARARQRMMASVPKADVVITNPTHFAVALQYDPKNMQVPICVAKGQDLIALRIREIATANKVSIVENPPLARALHASVEIDQPISPEHYKAVAEVISYVFRLRGRRL